MKKHRKCKKIIAFVTVLFIAFVAVIGLHKTGIYRFDFLKDIYKKIDFQLSTNELNIPQDALSFSVYDIEQGEYLFYEGDSQLPTVASLAKLFVIDYALTKVNLEDVIEVNQEVLELVPAGSSLANLYAGEYTVKQIMEAMLVPSGNDAAYVLAYHIAKNELGEGYTATEYIDYFMTELSEYLIEAGYSKTNLYNDPSGASMQADSHLGWRRHLYAELLFDIDACLSLSSRRFSESSRAACAVCRFWIVTKLGDHDAGCRDQSSAFALGRRLSNGD